MREGRTGAWCRRRSRSAHARRSAGRVATTASPEGARNWNGYGARMVVLSVVLMFLTACGSNDSTPRSDRTSTPATTPTPTPTPTQLPLPDLVALSVRERGCIGNLCGPYRFEICVENRGQADAGGFRMTLEGRPAASVSSLAIDDVACYAVAYSWQGGATGVFEVDPDMVVEDADRSNNTLNYPEPNPTGCDVICVGPTPTPARIR